MQEVTTPTRSKRIRGAGYEDHLQTARATARKSKLIGVHCTQRLVDAVENYIEAEKGEMTRPEAIRQILRRWLIQNGHYK